VDKFEEFGDRGGIIDTAQQHIANAEERLQKELHIQGLEVSPIPLSRYSGAFPAIRTRSLIKSTGRPRGGMKNARLTH
jgi:hypothetical protein